MTLTATPRMDVVKREEKEAKLKNFISNYLSSVPATKVDASWLLVARSVESPVVQALTALAPSIRAAGVNVKAVLAQVTAGQPDGSAVDVMGVDCELRLARDPRLHDAHEQLLIDDQTSWLGDCMRREPAKRDAYECHAVQCAVLADWGRKSFHHLWQRSEPVVGNAVVQKDAGGADAGFEPCVSQPVPSSETMVVSTRH